jgi:signal transduction histidine kinase
VPAALRRAVSALVDNALGHNHAGGTVTLSVTDHGSTVEQPGLGATATISVPAG